MRHSLQYRYMFCARQKFLLSAASVHKKFKFLVRSLLYTPLVLLVFEITSHAANVTWKSTGADTNWGTSTNWSSGSLPGTIDVAVFDPAVSQQNCTVNVNVNNVSGIKIVSGYTGTITQGAGITITVGSSGFQQAAGNFVGGDGAINVQTFTLSGGSFKSTSGNLTITPPVALFGITAGLDFTGSAPGAFVANNGTVTIVNDAASSSAYFNPRGQTFYNLIFYRSAKASNPLNGTPTGIEIVSNATVSNNCTILNDSNFGPNGFGNPGSNLILVNQSGFTAVSATITILGNLSIPQNNTSAGIIQLGNNSNPMLVFELNGPTSSFDMSDASATIQAELLFDGNGNQQYHQPGNRTSFDGLLEVNNPATTLTIVDNLSSITIGNQLGGMTLLKGSVVNTANNINLTGSFIQSGGTFNGGNNSQSTINFTTMKLTGGAFTSTQGNLSITPTAASGTNTGLDFTGSPPGAFVANNGTVTIVNDRSQWLCLFQSTRTNIL